MKLNDNIEVIAVDIKTQKSFLLAIKKEIYSEADLCLQVVTENTHAKINNMLYSIASTRTFKEYRLIEGGLKEQFALKCFKFFTEPQIRRINFLFDQIDTDSVNNDDLEDNNLNRGQ